MRFMMLVLPRDYAFSPPDMVPPKDLVEKMGKYNESLAKAGILVSLDGLHPPSEGARIKFSGGKPSRVDGPFAEAKEVLGGYWIIDVKSREEAIQWAMKAPMLDGDTIEVRRVQELSDFPPDIQAVVGVAELGKQ